MGRLLASVARGVLRIGLRGDDREYLRGDLEETYARTYRRRGRFRAGLWYVGQAIRSVAGRNFVGERGAEAALARDRRPAGWLAGTGQDVRFAARVLLKERGFSLAAITMLALGVGATTAIFTFVNGLALRPLPYGDGERLVQLEGVIANGSRRPWIGALEYRDWQERADSFSGMALFRPASFNAALEGEPVRVSGLLAEDDLFDVLEVSPVLGRSFVPGEDEPGAAPVVVLAHSLWERMYAADPAVLGETMYLHGRPYTIIGVMPEGFHFLEYAELWTPHRFDFSAAERGAFYWRAVARLETGVSVDEARQEMGVIGSRIAAQHPETHDEQSATATPLRDAILGDSDTHALIFLGVVVFVQMIATVNVGNLLLARALGRRRELAVRTAIGAGRGRLIRQLLTESLLLAAIGGLAGIPLGLRGRTLILDAVPADIPRWFDFSFDYRVAAFSAVVTALAGIVFGLLPALYACRDVTDALKDGGSRGSTGSPGIRNLLVVGEVALALVLLVGAGLMLKSAATTRAVDPGLDPTGVLTFTLSLPAAEYPADAEQVAFYDRLIEELEGKPGVISAAAISRLPLSNSSWRDTVVAEGHEPLPGERPRSANVGMITPDYFDVLGVPLLRGRSFTAGDDADSLPVAVVSESLATRLWPDRSPLGRRVRLGGATADESPWRTVVGVVGGVRHYGLDREPVETIYLPFRQEPTTYMTVALRSAGSPLALADTVRASVAALDADLPLLSLRTMEKVIDDSMWESRLYAWMFGVFAAIALGLASIGLYGLMAYSVRRQTREIGVRMALGAQPRRVLHLVVRQAVSRVLTGVALGVLGAVSLSRVLASLISGVSLLDPTVYATVALTLLAVAALSAVIPALRASRVDPLLALRTD